MRIAIFAHSWLSDWNHGNAHFLRGLASALVRRGHRVRCYEAEPEAWSLEHLRREPDGERSIEAMLASYGELALFRYGADTSWERELHGMDVVVAHEWNPSELLRELARARRAAGFRLLLHDTHHRAVSERAFLGRLPLADLDGVLAFGESLRRIYERAGVRRSYTFHEAADVERFRPAEPERAAPAWDVSWVGNWGDEERSREIEEFLVGPVERLGLRARVNGVRYPERAKARLREAGIEYGGYLPNLRSPEAYHGAKLAIHIPRSPYGSGLKGIPTIRVFEALACGAALVCAPWEDGEGLFGRGRDYAMAGNGAEMADLLKQLLHNPAQRMSLGQHGMETVRNRHTCAHRAGQLEDICRDLD